MSESAEPEVPAPKARTVSVFKTAVFKLHNPSRHKRAMLLDAMKRAHLAYGKLLAANMPDAAEIERLRDLPKREKRIAFNALRDRLAKQTTPWQQLSGGAKAAIAREATATIASHIGLTDVQEEAGEPTVARINATQPEYEAALEGFRDAIELTDENALRDELARVMRPGEIRPLGFWAVRPTDGFLLLHDPEAGRLYAYLNLHPKDGRFAAPVAVKDLVNVQTGEVVSFRSKTGALFPLELGHAFHDLGFVQRGRPQSARLVHRTERNGQPCDDFELHVAFRWETLALEPLHWIGIDRGIYNLAAFSVVDGVGRVVAEGVISGRELRDVQRKFERRTAEAQKRGRDTKGASKRRAWADEAVHVTANAIVAACLEHDARPVLEDLSGFSGIGRKKRVIGRRRGGFNKLLNRRQYEKLAQVLDYKLKEVGLPKPFRVGAAGTSQTCPGCSHRDPANRIKTPTADGFEMDRFKCVACGHEADADLNAARIIAMKAEWLTTLPKNRKRIDGKLAPELQFETYLRACAARRMGAPAPQGRTSAGPALDDSVPARAREGV